MQYVPRHRTKVTALVAANRHGLASETRARVYSPIAAAYLSPEVGLMRNSTQMLKTNPSSGLYRR